MTRWLCGRCGTVYDLALPACPFCSHAEDRRQVWEAPPAGPEPEPAPAAAEAVPDEPAGGASLGVVIPMPADEPAAEAAAADAVAEPEASAEDAASEVKAPPVRAPRADWAAHAVEVHGADPAEVDEMTKQQLIDAYGSPAAAEAGGPDGG